MKAAALLCPALGPPGLVLVLVLPLLVATCPCICVAVQAALAALELQAKRSGMPAFLGRFHPHSPFSAESTTLRVSNLSDDTSEMDLEAMFRPYGGVQRLYLAKDKETNYSKGFAFVSFYTRRDAQAAKDGLDGKGWDYLILNVDWAECVSAPSLLVFFSSSFVFFSSHILIGTGSHCDLDFIGPTIHENQYTSVYASISLLRRDRFCFLRTGAMTSRPKRKQDLCSHRARSDRMAALSRSPRHAPPTP